MAAPTRGLATSTTQIQVDYVALTGIDTGGASIDSYYIVWDYGTAGVQWYDL